MVFLTLAYAAVPVATAVFFGREVRRLVTGRRWQPLREAMLRDVATLPATYLARIDTRPEPEAGGVVIATDLVTGARGPLRLPGANFSPGSVVCFTWTTEGPEVRAWMSRRLWTSRAAYAAHRSRRMAPMAVLRDRARTHRTEREIRTAADQVVGVAEQILRDQRQG